MSEEVVSVLLVRSFRSLAARHLGLDIPEECETLVAARIAKRLQHLKMPVNRYLSRLYQEAGVEEIVEFWQLIRPRPAPFFERWSDYLQLRSHIEHRLARGGRRFRFWSAGCGSGEVAHAMAIVTRYVAELHGLPAEDLDLKILVTDISNAALAAGKRGLYESSQIVGMPANLRNRYFYQCRGGIAVVEAMQTHLVYRRLNLAQSPFPLKGPFDAVFCHEGLAPLVADARARIVPVLLELLAEDGVFCAGFARESHSPTEGVAKGGSEARVRVAPREPGDC